MPLLRLSVGAVVIALLHFGCELKPGIGVSRRPNAPHPPDPKEYAYTSAFNHLHNDFVSAENRRAVSGDLLPNSGEIERSYLGEWRSLEREYGRIAEAVDELSPPKSKYVARHRAFLRVLNASVIKASILVQILETDNLETARRLAEDILIPQNALIRELIDDYKREIEKMKS